MSRVVDISSSGEALRGAHDGLFRPSAFNLREATVGGELNQKLKWVLYFFLQTDPIPVLKDGGRRKPKVS